MPVDLKTGLRFAAVLSLLFAAYALVRALKPREAPLEVINDRDGTFGDMASAAQKKGSTGSDGDVSGLDMVPTTSLPLAGPDKAEPAPPPSAPVPQAAPAPEPAPAPAPAPARRAPAPKPRLQVSESPLDRPAATSSAFLAAPDEEKEKKDKQPKR